MEIFAAEFVYPHSDHFALLLAVIDPPAHAEEWLKR